MSFENQFCCTINFVIWTKLKKEPMLSIASYNYEQANFINKISPAVHHNYFSMTPLIPSSCLFSLNLHLVMFFS